MAENEVGIEIKVDSSQAEKALNSFSKSASKSLSEIDGSIDGVINSYDKLFKQIKDYGKSDKQIAKEQYSERFKIIKDTLNKGLISEGEAASSLIKIKSDLNQKLANLSKDSLKNVVGTNQKELSSFSSMFASMRAAALPIAAVIGSITAAYRTMSYAIDQANEDAKLTRQIGASLLATGESGSLAVKGIIDFADSIKDATGLSDDLVKQTFITAKSFGISTEQAKKLTQAAIDLAAATGVDVETAVRQLGGTLDGSIGKVGNLGEEFRNLTESQLKSGDAIELVSKKFGGTAAKELDTYTGKTNELKNAWDDFLKSLGRTVVDSDASKASIGFLTKQLNYFNDQMNLSVYSQENIERQLNAIRALGGDVARAYNDILTAQEKLALSDIEIGKQSKVVADGLAGIIEQEQGATKATADFEDRIKSLAVTSVKSVSITGKALEEANKKAQELAIKGKEFIDKIFANTGTEAEKAANKASQAILDATKRFREGQFGAVSNNEQAESFRTLQKIKLQIATDFNADISRINKEQQDKDFAQAGKAAQEFANYLKDLRDKQQQNIANAGSNPFGAMFSRQTKDLEGNIIEVSSEEIGSGIVGGIKMAMQGKQGAVKAIGQVAEGIGQAFGIPGIGGLAELLAQGPEATKKFIKEFINSIPDIIQAIAESIPVVVEVFVDTMVNRGGAARIGIAIAKAMAGQAIFARLGEQIFGKSGDELAKVIQSGATEYAKETQDSFTQAMQSFGPTVASGLQSLGTTLVESFNGFDDLFNNALDGFVDNLSSEFGYFFSTLGSSLFTFVASFPIALVNGVAEAVRTIFTGFDPLIGALRSLQSAVEKAGGVAGKGGGQGILAEGAAKIGKALGFAQGGIVPLYAASGAFVPKGTDTVPAMLTPGELVVPRDMVGELGSFLSMQNGNSNTSDTAMIAAILSAVQAPIIVKTEAKVNQNAFADIILQLNRQNARMTA